MIACKEKLVTRMSELRSEPVDWLWPGRLAAGTLTLLDGDPGQGKSLLTLDLAARLTKAQPLPDGFVPPEPLDVLLLAAEDDANQVVLPRLEAAGADLNRVHQMRLRTADGADCLPTFPDDAGLVAEALLETGSRLLIVDPFAAFLSAGGSMLSEPAVRGALASLVRLAERARAAVLLIRHLTKWGGGRIALFKGIGSVAIVGTARVAFLAANHPEDAGLHVLAATKNNLAQTPPSLAYRVELTPGGLPYVAWSGHVPLTADELFAARAAAPADELDEAIDFLNDLLAAGPLRREQVVRHAESAGISMRTLDRAKEKMHLISDPDPANARHRTWRLPSDEDLPRILRELWGEEDAVGSGQTGGEAEDHE